MKLLKFTAYLFYKYYSTGGTKDISYFSTIGVLCLLAYMHLVQILIIFNLPNILPEGHKSEIGAWIKMALFFLPFYLVFSLLIKERELKQMHFNEKVVKQGYFWLIVYGLISLMLLVLLLLNKGGKL